MAAFVIPTIFSAVDQLSAVVRRMGAGLESFGKKAGAISLKSAAAAAALTVPLGFAVKQVSDYETALNSFRTIVSDLDNEQFAGFEKSIQSVGDRTKKSYAEVAQSFEAIAGLNADFAKTADGLGLVSESAITLAKAARMDIGPAAENLVGIMNQFGYGADKANEAINVLAAGQAVGASSISQTAESLKVFGAVAKSSNTTLEQSVALIEVLAAKSIFGAEAGTALRGSFTRLQTAGLGYKSGVFQINDALTEAKKKIDSLRTAKEKDAYVTKLFGQENKSAGLTLLDSIDAIKNFTAGVTGTSEAQKAAGINGKSFAQQLADVRAQAQNLAVKVGKNLLPVLDKIVSKIAPVVANVTAWIDKNPKLAQGIAIGAIALTGLLWAISGAAAVIGAVTTITGAWTAANWTLNASFAANPVTWILLAIVALVAIIAVVIKKTKGWGEQWDEVVKWMTAVIEAYKQGFILTWLKIKDAFLSAIDAMVKGYYWFANKIGDISDEQYKKNIAQIEGEKKARLDAINVTTRALQASAATANQGIDWKLRWDDGKEEAKAANPKQAQQSGMESILAGMNGAVDVNVSAQSGSTATVTKSSGIAKPTVKPTGGKW